MAAKFAPNQAVRIRKDYPPGHLRTPYYCRGKTGIIALWILRKILSRG